MKKIFICLLFAFLLVGCRSESSITINIENHQGLQYCDLIIKAERSENPLNDYEKLYQEINSDQTLAYNDFYLTRTIEENDFYQTYIFANKQSTSNNIKNFAIIILLEDGNIIISEEINISAYHAIVYYDYSQNEITVDKIERSITILIFALVTLLGFAFLAGAIFMKFNYLTIRKFFIFDFICQIFASIIILNALFLDGPQFCFKTIFISSLFILILECGYIIIKKRKDNFKGYFIFMCIINIAMFILKVIFVFLCMLT